MSDAVFSSLTGYSPPNHGVGVPVAVDIEDDVSVVSFPIDTNTDMSYALQRVKLFYPFMTVAKKARKVGCMR